LSSSYTRSSAGLLFWSVTDDPREAVQRVVESHNERAAQ